MKVLVTGGGGYLGCHLVPYLLNRGHEVRVFDRFYFGESLARHAFGDSPHCTVIKGDIRQLRAFPSLLEGVEGIIHLASLSNDPSCDLDADMAIDVNLEGTKDLIRRAMDAGVRRFVFASSCSVYGKGVSERLDEQSPTVPVSIYAVTKLETEHFLLPLRSRTFEPVIARPATLFGWSPRMRFDLAINLMAASACRKKCITVMGGGKQWRPFLHVRDAARAFTLLLESPANLVSGEVFNTGFDEANYQIIDLARLVARQFPGVSVEVATDDEDVRTYNVRFGKIRHTLGFDNALPIDPSIEEIRDNIEASAMDPFSAAHFNVRTMKQFLSTAVAEGGEPIAPRRISLTPELNPVDLANALEILQWESLEKDIPPVRLFERAFAENVGAVDAVAVTNTASAIRIALEAAGIGNGDEVVMPPIIAPATVNAVLRVGARPIFADTAPETLVLDAQSLASRITPTTRAVIAGHTGGHPCDLDAVYAVAREHKAVVIEDGPHAWGARYQGVSIGARGDCICLGCGAGGDSIDLPYGVVTVQDATLGQRLRLLAGDGIAENDSVPCGASCSMDIMGAAWGLWKVRRHAQMLQARIRLAEMYSAALNDIEEITLPASNPKTDPAWGLMIVRLRLERLVLDRDAIVKALHEENISAGVHYRAAHRMPYFQKQTGGAAEDCPNAARAAGEILTLPLHPGMTDKHVQHVVAALRKVLLMKK